jgi:hypothetical protein
MTPREDLNGAPRRRARAAPAHKRKRKDESQYRSFDRGGPAEAERVSAERLAERVQKRLAKCKAFSFPNPRIVVEYETAYRALVNAERELGTIPKGWKPPPGTLGAAPIVEGTPVIIRERAEHQYEGLIDLRSTLVAKKIKGNRMIVEGLIDGVPAMIPVLLAHVQRAPEVKSKR